MICDKCGQNQANIHYTEIVNGNKNEVHLCDKCAHEKEMSSPFSIHHLLTGLLDNQIDGKMKIDYVEPKKCKVCGMTYGKFKETGKFGCSECYTSFNDRLDPLFKKIHGHNIHTGKIPNKAGSYIKTKKDIQKLKSDLENAIQKEEFEKAAELRDKIRDLKRHIEN